MRLSCQQNRIPGAGVLSVCADWCCARICNRSSLVRHQGIIEYDDQT